MACTNGSERKSGVDTLAYAGTSVLASALGGAWAWAAFLGEMIATELVDVDALCAVAQPTTTPFTLEEVLFAANPLNIAGDPGMLQEIITKARAYMRAYLWSVNCQCKAATGTVDCAPVSRTCVVGTNDVYPGSGPARYFPVVSDPWMIPAGTTGLRLVLDNVVGGSAWTLNVINDSGYLAAGVTGSGGGTYDMAYTYTSVRNVRFEYTGTMVNNAGNGFRATITAKNGCVPQPTTQPAPAVPTRPTGVPDYPTLVCTTEQDICTQLATLKRRVDVATELVTLIQRQAVPFALVSKAVHTGLSGNGSFAVQGIRSALVSLTTVPAWKGSEVGTPTKRIDVGSIRWGSPYGWSPDVPIDADSFSLDNVPGFATALGYSLPPGVVATITEFAREP